MKPPAIFLMGPTASGKTALAMRLVEHFAFDIINVDAALVYRDMNIGTGKPTLEELSRAPHRLIDIRDPAEPYSAADFVDDALKEMRDIHALGCIPLLVGGTMFYFNALEYGLPELPSADAALRAELEKQAADEGRAALHARLAALDAATAARLHPNDSQRVQRALEICLLTGRPASAYPRPEKGAVLPFRPIKLALVPAHRQDLSARITSRFDAMLEAGLIEEVRALYTRGDLDPTLPALRMVGYRQVWDYLAGRIDYDEMRRTAIQATGQLAKRQMTWLGRYPDVHRLEYDAADLLHRATVLITSKLDKTGL